MNIQDLINLYKKSEEVKEHHEEIKKGDTLTVIKKITTTITYNQVPTEILNKYMETNKLTKVGK